MIDALNKFFYKKTRKKQFISFEEITFKINQDCFFNKLFFKINSNGITLIMGPNGAGKTLCMKIIAGLIQPLEGKIKFNEPKKPRISYVSQETVFLRRNVYDNLAYALKINKFSESEIKYRIESLVSIFNFKDFLYLSARKLSFGQQQLLSVIRSLIIKPDIILLDEPCSNIEPNLTKEIENILKKISVLGIKVILVTHDILQAKRLADDILFIHKGVILEQTKKEEFFKRPKSKFGANYIKGKLIN